MRDELARRGVHVSGTLVPAAYLADLLSWRAVQWLLLVAAVVAVVLEAVRLVVGLDWVVYEKLTRPYEANNPAGYALAVVAGALVVWAFAPVVAVPALLMLTIADPFAGLLGSVDDADSRKAPWVMAATLAVCLAIAVPFLPPRAAVPAAVTAVVADAVKPRVAGYVVDDNFSIPVGAAVVGFLGLTYLPVLVCEGSCLAAGG